MFKSFVLRIANNLLSTEPILKDRLALFSGQTAHLRIGGFLFPLEITNVGMLSTGDEFAPPSVSITLPEGAFLSSLHSNDTLVSSIQVSGAAELAEALGFVFRNLRWDAEDSFSRLIGDIPARRFALGARLLASSPFQMLKNLAFNLSEYISEESPLLVKRMDSSNFCAAVNCLTKDLARIESRTQRLETS
jgi:ubiquinone biosynthesis protein UbiJ